MKNFNNLITMTNVMRHNSRTAVNPDGQPTVKQQSRLMPHQGWFRNLAMIFAVLVMSMANVGMAWGASTTVEFKTSTKDDSNVALAALANGDTRLVGGGLAKLIAANSVAISTSANKYGYRCDGSRLYIVFKFDGETDLTIRHNVNSTGARYMRLYSFSSTKALSAIASSDWGTKTQKSFSSTNSSSTWGSGQASVVTTNDAKTTWNYTTKGCLTVTWEDLPAGYYVLDGTGSEAYIYSFTADVTAASCTNPTASWSTAPANGTAGGNMNASLTTNYAAGVVYTSSNTDVATVSGNGTATCAINYVAAGTARITATVTGDGSTICAGPATCYTDITVSAPEPSCGETAQAALTLSSNSGTICGTGTATFTVSGGSGTGALSVSSSDPSKATASIDGSTVTVTGVAAGSATITVTKACDATYAEKTATYSATVAAIPTANAGEDKTTEPGNGVALAATAAASGCTGAWTIQSGPNTSTAQLSSTSLATATFTPTVAGTYTLRWTVTNTSSSCSAYDEMTVTAAVCSISSCGNATLTYPIYTSGDLTTSNLFSGATSSNATAVSVGASPAFTGVTVSAATKGSSASAGACYAKSTPLTGKMKYSASSKSSSYYIDFPFTVNTGYTFTPCDVQVVIQPVSSNQAFTVEITNGTNVYGTSTATLNAGVMEPIIGLTSPAEMSAGNYAIRLYPHGGSNKEFRMGANVILKGTTAAVASDAYGIYIGKNNDNYTLENLTNTSGTTWSKTITLDAGSYYEFKVKKTPSAGDAVWYGNNGKITATTSPAWDFNISDGNCKLYTTVAGSYTFSWDASTNKLTVTYPAGDHPTKRIYMACGSGTWCDATPKFFVHSWGVTEYNTQVQQNACGEYYADIIWYNDYFQFTRNNSTATAYDDQNWNYSQDLTYNSSQLLWTFSSWSGNTGNFSSSAYTPTTYTISYAAGSTTATGGAAISGSKASETKTCDVDFTLPSSAVFTATGYTQVGWTTTDGGAQTHALGGSYTDNAAQTFYPVWEAAASLTALECNTRYTVQDMTAGGCGTLSSTSCYSAGLSANNRFEVLGDPSLQGNDGGTPEQKTNTAQTINSISFNSFMYLKGDGLNGASEPANPTCRGVKFIIPSAGKLTIYYRYGDRSKLKKEGQTGVNVGTTTGGYGYNTHDVTAGTYYIYGASSGAVLIAVEYQCCTTPAAPTAFAAGSITSTGATFSITDAGDAASYDIYYSESSTAPTAGTAATTTSTEKTKAVTGLTASTTYYAWVRSVCDADHKSAWVALSGSSFTTSAAAATPILSWALATNSASWTATPTNNDETNLTDVATSTEHAAIQSGATSGKTCKISLSSSATPDKYVTFTFKVACGKKLTPSSVWMEVANVGGSSGGKMTHKAELSDTYGHTISATVVPASDGVLNELNITNGGGTYFQGEVTLKVWAWNSSGTNGTAFRMGPNVKIFGAVGNQATPAATITWNTQPENGQVGDPDFAYDVTCSDGSTVTVTSANTTYATIVGGKLHYAAAGTTHLVATATDACGNTVTPVNSNDFTVSAAAPTYSVTHNLSNVTATSGATGAGAATEGVAYDAVFAANTGYVLPSTITVTIGGSPATVGTGYTWNASTGAFQVPAAQVTGAIVITIAGETAPATKDIYYGAITITAGALTKGSTGTSQFFTNIGGTIANNTEISWSSGPGAGAEYYESNVLTDTELSKSSNWNTSSGSNRYVGGMKFQSGSTYTLALGSKVASSITFYGRNGSASKTMTVGGEDWTSSSTKNTFAKHVFSKSGGFTGNVSITQDGDFYGILVIAIQTATPCTTPVIPALSNQSLCEGTDIAAWNATVTNAAAIEAAGESIAYSWKKKGNDTELANTATFDLGSSATESQAGTYVVTVTVSKAGKASSSAYREVELSVTESTEVTSITADKATVYEGNSVTLTATANTTVTWQWFTCTNAAGDGESSIGGATSAAYAIASAPAAGTHYYKVKATSSCGTGSMVYTLTVSAAAGGDCETEFWFAKAADKPESATAATHITGTPSGSSSATYTATIDGNSYPITGQTGQKTGNVTIVVPEGNEGTLYVVVQGSSSRTITLSKGGVQVGQYTPANSTWGTFTFADLDEGTYTLVSSGNIGWGIIALKLCSGTACTDPEVTASVNNSTACVGSSVTFTATGAHASATYQWQKYSGTWTNISDETASTYTIASVVAGDAGKYRVIASHDCNRTSNEVTLSVPSVPNFGSTVPASVSVMQTIALSINTVEATDAVKYRWYKSADATWDAGDTEIGTNKELIKAYDGEAIGNNSYYIFCRAQNACGITTSTAIAVNVTAYVEEDCATRGSEVDAEFGFENTSMSSGTYDSKNVWYKNSNSAYLTYTAPTGKYFKTAKVTIASSNSSNASYQWSTDGSSWTAVTISGLTTTLTETEINLAAKGSGRVTHFRIGRNLDGAGESSGTFYLHKACFEYTEACTSTTVTPSTASVDYEMGGEWSNPTFTLSVAGTLTYSSSNEDIASVDDDGTVTFNGEAGTVTITASYAGGTISETEYCASSGSYTINVSCPGGAPKIVAASSVNMSGCNSSVTLNAKTQAGADFADGTYQWFRNGEEIDGATSSSYTATQAGTYTVERTNTSDCTTPSTNSAIVTSETTEPEVERLVPFQYYHVDSIYRETSIMRFRHLFAVKNSGKLDGKSFKLYVSRNGGAATDVTSSNALVVVPNGDGHVDTVMVDLNKLSGKYSENDELVFTCKAIDCSKNISDVYKNTITMNVIGATPTLALICSGSNKAGGTRKTGELTVGGDFLTGYNVADLCQQTGNTSFDANTEWGLYTRLKENYIVTPVNGYAVFNKLNYEPFDILLLTDYPKASKSDAAATVLDDMADLCDYRPMLSFKAHMVAKTPSKWAAKGFTTSPVVPKNTRTRLNIVCYAHPMFSTLKSTATHIQKDNDDPSQIVYTMLEGAGYEGSKGLQGFELEAAENFVTIGLVHYNATPADGSPSEGWVTWAPGSEDRMLVTAVERQENIEARMIMFAVNCGAQSKFTETGRNVVLKCLQYLLDDDPLHVADCSFTFDNGAGNSRDAAKQAEDCPTCTGTKGDGKWSTAANWGPDYVLRPGKDTEVKIAAPVTVDNGATNFTPKVRSVRIVEGGKIEIPAGSYLEVVSTIRRQDGNDLLPTEVEDLHIGSSETGNGTLIFNNNSGDTKAQVDMYSKGFIDHTDPANEPNGVKNYQYIGTPFVEVNALYNYYGSWIYSWGVKKNGNWGWVAVKNGGPMTAWTGYCITQEAPTYHQMSGTLTATGTVDIPVEAGQNMVVGNSWTAPIDIKNFADEDFEHLQGNVYFFNTGVDKKGEGTVNDQATGATRWAAGTYVSVPIHAASYTDTDDHIPSMQGFFVKSDGSKGTLHLDYDKLVRNRTRASALSGEMHAPARRAAVSSNEPAVLKIKVSGTNYDDKLLLLEREDFTSGYDKGWDGDKWDGNESALYLYAPDNAGTENSVMAVPELEGTIIGFRAGEEDDAYTLNFEYLNSDEPLYLYDSENSTYTRIMTGVTYRFFTTDKSKHARFIITRKSPQITTAVGNVSDDGLRSSKVKKLLLDNKLFILRNGMLYDATGKIVK